MSRPDLAVPVSDHPATWRFDYPIFHALDRLDHDEA